MKKEEEEEEEKKRKEKKTVFFAFFRNLLFVPFVSYSVNQSGWPGTKVVIGENVFFFFSLDGGEVSRGREAKTSVKEERKTKKKKEKERKRKKKKEKERKRKKKKEKARKSKKKKEKKERRKNCRTERKRTKKKKKKKADSSNEISILGISQSKGLSGDKTRKKGCWTLCLSTEGITKSHPVPSSRIITNLSW